MSHEEVVMKMYKINIFFVLLAVIASMATCTDSTNHAPDARDRDNPMGGLDTCPPRTHSMLPVCPWKGSRGSIPSTPLTNSSHRS